MKALKRLTAGDRPLYLVAGIDGRSYEMDRIDVEQQVVWHEAQLPHPAARHAVDHWRRVLAGIDAVEGVS